MWQDRRGRDHMVVRCKQHVQSVPSYHH